MLKFNRLLIDSGFDPSVVRLIRHRHARQFQRRLFDDALHGNPRFEQYQAGQANPTVVAQMSSAKVLAVFVAEPGGDTVFMGLWRVNGVEPGHSPDPYRLPLEPPKPGSSVFDLEKLSELSQFCGRIVVAWGGGERAWVQYANRHDKEIIEVRRRLVDPPFPGYSRFTSPLHELDSLPETWIEPLRVVRGVYLIVHRTTGVQYVGSACGADGFIGRWRGYSDGHGGNVALRELGHSADQYASVDTQIRPLIYTSKPAIN